MHHLYGDIVLLEENGTFITDLSLLNNFKKYSSSFVEKVGSAKLITIIPENIDNSINTQWQSLANELETSKGGQFEGWSKTIKNYCKNVELALNQLKSKKSKLLKEKVSKFEGKEALKKQKTQILEGNPCIYLKRTLTATDFQLTQIGFTEKYLSLLGYPVYSFINIVLREGIPQIELACAGNAEMLQSQMQNFMGYNEKDCQPTEFSACITLKYGYTRVIKYRMYNFLNYEDGHVDIDTIYEVISKEDPLVPVEILPSRVIKEDFLEAAIGEDENAATFLKVYYNEIKTQRYRCLSQVCKIREISVPKVEEEELM